LFSSRVNPLVTETVWPAALVEDRILAMTAKSLPRSVIWYPFVSAPGARSEDCAKALPANSLQAKGQMNVFSFISLLWELKGENVQEHLSEFGTPMRW